MNVSDGQGEGEGETRDEWDVLRATALGLSPIGQPTPVGDDLTKNLTREAVIANPHTHLISIVQCRLI